MGDIVIFFRQFSGNVKTTELPDENNTKHRINGMLVLVSAYFADYKNKNGAL